MNKMKLITLMIVMICATPLAQAHPLEKLMPFVTRILWNSKSYLEYAPGLWIKKLTEPYGLKCQYPLLVKKTAEKVDYAAYAHSDHPETNAIPKRDKLGRVILDITDKDLVQTTNEHIVFDYDFVNKNQHDPKLLTAVLFHEVKHLNENHQGKYATLQRQADYAGRHGLSMALSNGTPVSHSQFYGVINPGLGLLEEEEADSSVKRYPDLCRMLAPDSGYFKRDLKQFRSSIKVWKKRETGGSTGSSQKIGPVKDKKVFDLYRKACLGDRQSYEYLEQTYRFSHPMSIRQLKYFNQWAQEAEKNQVKEHPNLNDAWLDYCTRHITKLEKPKDTL